MSNRRIMHNGRLKKEHKVRCSTCKLFYPEGKDNYNVHTGDPFHKEAVAKAVGRK